MKQCDLNYLANYHHGPVQKFIAILGIRGNREHISLDLVLTQSVVHSKPVKTVHCYMLPQNKKHGWEQLLMLLMNATAFQPGFTHQKAKNSEFPCNSLTA